ncbi:FUN14 domain-containing protein [Thiorhodococcus mannitoliphagus]|nr:FUN14 domain-containing protein [Thiorhodococcus mannitoliphagus]
MTLGPLSVSAQPMPGAGASTDGGALFSQYFFLKLGFSFMVGLAMGFALKVAFKIALFVVGLLLLSLFGLQLAGVIDVNWSGMEIHYDGLATWLGAAAGSFFGYVGDNLTSAASFFAGLAVGLKL